MTIFPLIPLSFPPEADLYPRLVQEAVLSAASMGNKELVVKRLVNFEHLD
jgi:hypothetical protein